MNQKRLGWILWSGQWSQAKYARISRSAWKGEFVVERKALDSINWGTSSINWKRRLLLKKHLLHLALLFTRAESFVQPQPSAKTLQPVPRPKKLTFSFNKQPQIGAAVGGLVAVIAFAWFFSFRWTKCDGVWLRNTDSSPITYELSGKKQRVNGDETIKRFSRAMKRKEFNTALFVKCDELAFTLRMSIRNLTWRRQK